MEQAGLLVRVRHSDRAPGVVTGYAVALPGDHTAGRRPVWFGGGRLAADLTWPKLAARWPDAVPPGVAPTAPRHRLSPAERSDLWRRVASVASAAAAEVGRLASADPAAGADVAHATADVLSVAAHVVEGRRYGPLSAAADAFDRAGRDLHGRPPVPSPAGTSLRAAARLLAMTGRAGRDETAQVLALVAELAALSDAVAGLRDVQDRAAQATAARHAAEHLRRLPPPPADPGRPGPAIHSPRPVTALHRPAAAAMTATGSRRRVRP
jgi:hypothetical protein